MWRRQAGEPHPESASLLAEKNKEGPLEISPAFPEAAATILEHDTKGEGCTWECGSGSWNLYSPQILSENSSGSSQLVGP